MSTETKEFPLGVILSVTHDRLMARKGMSEIYEILNWMTGDSLYTHQLPRAAREAEPVLRAALPFLSSISLDHVDKDNWQAVLDDLTAKFGPLHAVPKMDADQHECIDPLSELAEMVHPDKIVVVKP